MKKYIVESWLRIEREYTEIDKAKTDKKIQEKENNKKDVRIIEVIETRKEL